jgi:hypothetical protein
MVTVRTSSMSAYAAIDPLVVDDALDVRSELVQASGVCILGEAGEALEGDSLEEARRELAKLVLAKRKKDVEGEEELDDEDEDEEDDDLEEDEDDDFDDEEDEDEFEEEFEDDELDEDDDDIFYDDDDEE